MSNKSRGAAEVFKDAKGTTAALKSTLKAQPPWNRDVEFHRQKARNLYLNLLFGHPLSTYAQSIDHLWLDTSYTLIMGYRDMITRLEAGKKVDLRKALTRFRQALQSEDTFYRSLLARFVSFYQLQPLVRDISIVPVAEGPDKIDLSPEEKEQKLGLVYKVLICLGDLERYKEQYEPKEDRFAKAKVFYEQARSLQPDQGTAFNQLAVISSYTSDNFLCVYYYFRALAVKHPFPSGEANLERIFKKIYEKKRIVLPDEVEEFKQQFLVSLATIFRGEEAATDATLLQTLLQSRSLPAETVVKLTATTIGSHWHARMSSKGEKPALDYLLAIFTAILTVALEQLSAPPGEQLHVNITAVLRRLLPSLRIISKWLKINPTPQTFFDLYLKFTTRLGALFPLAMLPSLTEPLEEDIDMRGFSPLKRGHETSTTPETQVHPNEEQLMRISDLLVDCKLLQSSDDMSVSTDEDPVNLAMRATLGDEDEEVILWERRAPTAFDLLESLAPAPVQQVATPPLLFGGEGIWSMGREDTSRRVSWESPSRQPQPQTWGRG